MLTSGFKEKIVIKPFKKHWDNNVLLKIATVIILYSVQKTVIINQIIKKALSQHLVRCTIF